MYKNHFITVIIAAVVAQGIHYINTQSEPELSTNDQIAAYYTNAAETLVSPHSIRKRMVESKQDFILVDVRSAEEYSEEHIVGAVSIPAYVDRENSAKTDADRIVDDFRTLQQENPNKDIIIYCYSSSCMTGRKIGRLLADNDVFVKEMTIGWNEWRFFWQQWNYPHEWDGIDPLDYVATGTEPGTFSSDTLIVPCDINNEFGC